MMTNRLNTKERADLADELLKKTGGKCAYCGRAIVFKPDVARPAFYADVDDNDRAVIDHIVPLVYGGGNEISNLIPSCKICNSGKGKKTIEDFRAGVARKYFGLPASLSTRVRRKLSAVLGIDIDGMLKARLIEERGYILWFEKHKPDLLKEISYD